MSVPKSERGVSDFRVLDLALNLAKHTAQKASNEKLIPKNKRWVIAYRLIESSFDAYENIRSANEIYVKEGDEVAYKIRHEYQLRALASLSRLLGDLDIAHRLYKLSDDELTFWAGLCSDTRTALKSWIKSDVKRFG